MIMMIHIENMMTNGLTNLSTLFIDHHILAIRLNIIVLGFFYINRFKHCYWEIIESLNIKICKMFLLI